MEENILQFQFGITMEHSNKLDAIAKQKGWSRKKTAVSLIQDILDYMPPCAIENWNFPSEKSAEKYLGFFKGGDFVENIDSFVEEGGYPWTRRSVARKALEVGIDLYHDNQIEKKAGPIIIDEKVLRSLVAGTAA